MLSRIGFINKLNGFAGEVCLALERDIPLNSFKGGEKFLFIKIDGIAVPFAVENIFEKGGKVIVKFEGVNDSEYPKRFLNSEVLIESNRMAKVKEEVSWKDLVGFEMIDSSYGSLGKVDSIEEYPQQVIAKCTIHEKEVLIPLHDDLIENIDVDQQKIFLNLPDGLIDAYTS